MFKSFSTTSRALFLLAAEYNAAAYRPSVPDTWHGAFTSPALRTTEEEKPRTKTRNWLKKISYHYERAIHYYRQYYEISRDLFLDSYLIDYKRYNQLTWQPS